MSEDSVPNEIEQFADEVFRYIQEPGDPMDNQNAVYCQKFRGYVNPASEVVYGNQALPFLEACDCLSAQEGKTHYYVSLEKIAEHLSVERS